MLIRLGSRAVMCFAFPKETAAERAALKSDIKLQRSQTYAATPENTSAAVSVTSLKAMPLAKNALPAQFAAN